MFIMWELLTHLDHYALHASSMLSCYCYQILDFMGNKYYMKGKVRKIIANATCNKWDSNFDAVQSFRNQQQKPQSIVVFLCEHAQALANLLTFFEQSKSSMERLFGHTNDNCLDL